MLRLSRMGARVEAPSPTNGTRTRTIEIFRKVFMKYWTTKSGEKIAIKDMTTDHIKNCIRMLSKAPDLHSEADAMEDIGANFSAFSLREQADRIDSHLAVLKEELKKRGVNL